MLYRQSQVLFSQRYKCFFSRVTSAVWPAIIAVWRVKNAVWAKLQVQFKQSCRYCLGSHRCCLDRFVCAIWTKSVSAVG